MSATSSSRHRLRERVRAQSRQRRERHFRSHPRNPQEVLERVLLGQALEAEQRELVLPHVKVGVDGHLVALGGQGRERVGGHAEPVADPADVEQCEGGPLHGDAAGEKRDHALGLLEFPTVSQCRMGDGHSECISGVVR